MDEGYIKFKCNWVKTGPFSKDKISAINTWRNTLYKLGLIGVYDNGIGYGNISIRINEKSFLISGSTTGKLKILNGNHYALVNGYNIIQNEVTCVGPVKASSESLSHAIIYECSPDTNAVIHIHNAIMWGNLINSLPATGTNILYGTPEMAIEIGRLFNETNLAKEKILVMGGHPEGIIVFGQTIEEAGEILLKKQSFFQ